MIEQRVEPAFDPPPIPMCKIQGESCEAAYESVYASPYHEEAELMWPMRCCYCGRFMPFLGVPIAQEKI